MDKLSFPKGSLKFKKLTKTTPEIEKSQDWKNFLRNIVARKKFVDSIEESYPYGV